MVRRTPPGASGSRCLPPAGRQQIDEVTRRAPRRQEAARVRWRVGQAAGVRGRDDAEGGQPADAAAVAEFGGGRVQPRVEPGGSLRQAGEIDGLGEAERGGVLVEIGASGGLRADEAVAVGKGVEIAFEDFGFAEATLQFPGGDGLARLGGERASAEATGGEFDELFGDGRGAGDDPAGAGVARRAPRGGQSPSTPWCW